LNPVSRLLRGLARTRQALKDGLERVLGSTPGAQDWEALEETLLAADVGPRATREILEALRRAPRGGGGSDLRARLRSELLRRLSGVAAPPAPGAAAPGEGGIRVVVLVGVNGSGKTTTAGKLAHRLAAQGERVILAAADTFRAAAIEQAQAWAERAGCEIVTHARGADAAAVVHDALEAARARGGRVVVVDTAGRLHTRKPLMEELGKVARVAARGGGRPEILLVIDATTGQNAVQQAREFLRAAGVTGLVLTKLDGTARGGVAVPIASELGLPIRYVGVGEALEDLLEFEAGAFVDALLGVEAGAPMEP
jgi:fused signal recognition particle receptor